MNPPKRPHRATHAVRPMGKTFKKESLLIEWLPITILLAFSLAFAIFAVLSNTVFHIVAGLMMSIFFAVFPIFAFSYLQSFSHVTTSGRTIGIHQKSGRIDFDIPEDLGRVKIDADDLTLELRKNGRRFILRTHFLKNKSDFHRWLDRVIREHPPSPDRVILKASVLEIMDRIKKG